MPTISFPKEELKEYLHGDVEDETLRESLSMIGTDIDSFDEEINVEVFPNRPDLLSVQGIARALNHFLGFVEEIDEYKVEEGREVVKVLPTVKTVRPYTRCAIVRGLALDDARLRQIIDIQEKLHITFGRNRKKVAIGIYPIEKIRMPITYGAEAPEDIVFVPLEAEGEMNAKQMLENYPTGQKYAHLLEGQKIFPVFRDAAGKVLSVPPILNSEDVGKVTVTTTDVFIECSGHNPKPLSEALAMICCALSDMGGTIESMIIEDEEKIRTPQLVVKKARVNKDYVIKRAGIPGDKLEESLMRMGIHLDGDIVHIPCYRTDFLHDVDVVEDALIGYGYQNVESRVPQIHTIGKLTHETTMQTAIRELLTGLGITEVMNYYLVAQGVPLANPLNQNFGAMRTELLGQLLDTLSKNTSNQYPQQLFEIGPVFSHDETTETRIAERTRIGIVLCGESADFTRARQSLEVLANVFGWTLTFSEHEGEKYIPGRCARVTGDVKGVLGEIHPQQLITRGITFPVAAFEIEL